LERESFAKVRLYHRTATSGTVVETALATGLPHQLYGLYAIPVGSAGNWGVYCYMFPQVDAAMYGGGPSGFTWVPTRVGFFTTTSGGAGGRGCKIDWWYDNFI
jgi:hypothetical protein